VIADGGLGVVPLLEAEHTPGLTPEQLEAELLELAPADATDGRSIPWTPRDHRVARAGLELAAGGLATGTAWGYRHGRVSTSTVDGDAPIDEGSPDGSDWVPSPWESRTASTVLGTEGLGVCDSRQG